MDIDIVYTWVNGNDPIHAEERAKALNRPRDKTAYAPYRWTDHNELYYSILSVRKFAPWIRNIYIVVSLAQRPPNIEESKNLHFIDDSFLLPEKCLPTFNSHSIESNLHRIPGLAEHFLYANDDMFFGAPVEPTDFFDPKTGFPRISEGEVLPQNDRVPPLDIFPGWYAARLNNAQLLNRLFGKTKVPRKDAKHQIRPILKSVMEWMWQHPIIQPLLRATTATKFRHSRNLEPVGLAIQCAIGLRRNGLPANHLRCVYISVYDKQELDLQRLTKKPTHLFCLNDNCVLPNNTISTFLHNYFITNSGPKE